MHLSGWAFDDSALRPHGASVSRVIWTEAAPAMPSMPSTCSTSGGAAGTPGRFSGCGYTWQFLPKQFLAVGVLAALVRGRGFSLLIRGVHGSTLVRRLQTW